LAATCRALAEPITARLWETIGCLSALLKALPKDYLQRQILAEDVEALDRCSARVLRVRIGPLQSHWYNNKPEGIPDRFLKLKEGEKRGAQDDQLWYDVWNQIARVRPKTSRFLPNLQEIRVHDIREAALLPLVGTIDGANLAYIRIRNLQHRTPESIVRKLLEMLPDTPKLEYLFVRDGQTGLVPPEMIKRSPLKQLRLPPRTFSKKHELLQFQTHALMPEVLTSSGLWNLTLDLTRDWYTPEIEALVGKKYLPCLTNLWLDLTTFMSEPCKHTICRQSDIHGWTCLKAEDYRVKADVDTLCQRKPPQVFFEFLDRPELRLLNIKFGPYVYGKDYLAVVRAAEENCRLQNLEELVLGGGGWHGTCTECDVYPDPQIPPQHLRESLTMLLPLAKLRSLRMSAAPNLIGDDMDLNVYAEIGAGLPLLEELILGHSSFNSSCQFSGNTFHELIPLQNLAVLCSFLPSLRKVEVGTVDIDVLDYEWESRHDLVSPNVTTLTIWRFSRTTTNLERAQKCIATWFPNSSPPLYRVY
jgi:hypothetical protein